MLGRIDLKEFMAWAESVKAEARTEEKELKSKHIKWTGKLNAAYAFGCDRQNGGGGS